MKYLGAPRWRYLALPLIVPSIVLFGLVTVLSIGTIRGMGAFSDLMDWAMYE